MRPTDFPGPYNDMGHASLQDMTISSENGPYDPHRPSELVFRVKLSPEEYEFYLRERYSRV